MTRRISRDGVVGAVVAILLVAVSMAGYRQSDTPDPYERVVVPLDEARAFQTGRLVVSDVRVAQRIKKDDDVYPTTGLYVVVHVAAQATGGERLVIGDSALTTDGVTYSPALSLGETIIADPGFETSSDYVFEVDPARLAGLTLEVWQQGVVYRYYQRAQTPLGITAGNADRWRAAGRDVQLTVERNDVTRAIP